jgi:phage shock protein PspC (stress-responsive transcriptional regulator)
MAIEQGRGGPTRPPRLLRSRENRIIGGVCAGIARRLGVDSAVVRLVAVALTFVSGGGAVLAYLLAWILMPQDSADAVVAPPPVSTAPQSASAPRAVGGPGAQGAREAWNAVGGDLRALATELRTRGKKGPPAAGTAAEDVPGTSQASRSPVDAVDAAMTELGRRVREPEVRAGARRAAASLSTAVSATVDELGRRGRGTDDPKH